MKRVHDGARRAASALAVAALALAGGPASLLGLHPGHGGHAGIFGGQYHIALQVLAWGLGAGLVAVTVRRALRR